MSLTICYGNFPGGDPRDFVPDSDARPEELEAWRKACEDALFAEARGEEHEVASAHQSVSGVGFITFTRFGLGTYLVECEDEP